MTLDLSIVPQNYTPERGELLFHYTTLEGAIGILQSRTMWLSDFARMNDPSEYHYARDCYLDDYQSRETFVDMAPRLCATTALLGLEQATNMFIGCLSQHQNDPHLWQHYGQAGAGCMIGIDAEFLADWAGVSLRRIVYERAEISRFVTGGLRMLQSQYEEAPDKLADLQDLARFFVSDLYAFKHPDYREEKEIRVSRLVIRSGDRLTDVGGTTRSGDKLPGVKIDHRQGLRGDTPYLALPLARGKRNAIRSITLGLGMDALKRIEAAAWEGLEILRFP